MVRSRWPPSARPSRPWMRMKRLAEKRPGSQPDCAAASPTQDDGTVLDGAPRFVVTTKQETEAVARRVKSKRRQATSPMP